MRRTVTASIGVTAPGPVRLAFQVAAATGADPGVEEVRITHDGLDVGWAELAAPHGGRVWWLDSPPGRVALEYRATVGAPGPGGGPPGVAGVVDVADELTYLRPSRYCESDRMTGFATRLFGRVGNGREALAAVASWVGGQLEYVSGSSGPTDGAVDTLLAGRGVCRDYAHLAVALLRALEVPARVVAVYAPGLSPMDFHAVAEALVDGAWHVVDGTGLAPRSSLVRIATGRDAADTSWLTSHGAEVRLEHLAVTATVEGDLPADDGRTPTTLP